MGFAAAHEMAKSATRPPESESVAVDWFKPETLQRWRGDFFGGTVAASIAAPYGMSLEMAMGLRPESGLYTSIIGGAISGMISNAPLATPGLSATVVPVLAVFVRTNGVGGGALISLLFFVKRSSVATRLEPIVPDPAEKEPSAINPIFKPRRSDLYQSSLFRFGWRERLRSQWRQSTSNSLQASEENNHDQSTTLRTA